MDSNERVEVQKLMDGIGNTTLPMNVREAYAENLMELIDAAMKYMQDDPPLHNWDDLDIPLQFRGVIRETAIIGALSKVHKLP